MNCLRWGVWILLVPVFVFSSIATAQDSIGASNVLMVYNRSSADSIQVANYYAQVHPGVHLLGLSGITKNEDISADYYLQNIRPQILSALSPGIDVIVTAKDLPLRISVTEPNPNSYVDPFGVTRNTSGTGWWKTYSSLESELTRIDTISTWQQMGDQFYASLSGGTLHPPPTNNPYYQQVVNPSISFHDSNLTGGKLRLTSRLDGYSVADVKNAIDRAKHAVVLPQLTQIVLDDDPVQPYDRMVELKNNVLLPRNLPVAYNNTAAPLTTASGPVIGYVSHGVHGGGLNTNYVTGQLGFQLANGAVFETHESYNAASFRVGGNAMGQGQIAQWLAVGGTAGVGNVQEPGAGLNYEANEDQMFKMLLEGKTWAEAAWSSLRQLSYVNTVVGDPLMTWQQIVPGDINMDGLVDHADFSILARNWGEIGQPGGAFWSSGDLNYDGVVNSADLTILQTIGVDIGHWEPPPSNDQGFIPEPSTGILFLMSLTVCFAGIVLRSFRQ